MAQEVVNSHEISNCSYLIGRYLISNHYLPGSILPIQVNKINGAPLVGKPRVTANIRTFFRTYYISTLYSVSVCFFSLLFSYFLNALPLLDHYKFRPYNSAISVFIILPFEAEVENCFKKMNTQCGITYSPVILSLKTPHSSITCDEATFNFHFLYSLESKMN